MNGSPMAGYLIGCLASFLLGLVCGGVLMLRMVQWNDLPMEQEIPDDTAAREAEFKRMSP